MRPEIALIIAETIGIIVGAGLSLLDDGRVQYGIALVLASLPVFYLIASVVLLLNFWCLLKLKRQSHLNYLALGFVWAIAALLLIINVGGVIAGINFGVAIVITFISFNLLIGLDNVQKN